MKGLRFPFSWHEIEVSLQEQDRPIGIWKDEPSWTQKHLSSIGIMLRHRPSSPLSAGLHLGLKGIPKASHRTNHVVSAQCPAQSANMYVNSAGVHISTDAPDHVEQLVAGKYPLGALGQGHQQTEFGRA